LFEIECHEGRREQSLLREMILNDDVRKRKEPFVRSGLSRVEHTQEY